MSTISVNPAYGGGYAPRTSISGLQWTEVTPAYGGGLFYDGLIGSFRPILNVKTWTPAQDDEEVEHGHSVNANIEALLSQELDILYDEGTDFDNGTFNNVEVIGDALVLTTSPYIEDWEGVTPLNNWTKRFTGSPTLSVVDDGSGENNILYTQNWNKSTLITADNGPYTSDVELQADFKFNTANINGFCSPAWRITGSGTACRGYCIRAQYNVNVLWFYRITGDGTFSQLAITSPIGFYITTGVWYTLKVKNTGSSHWFKIWRRDTESEPGSWSWLGSDSTHAGPGDVGMNFKSSSANETYNSDNFKAEPVPPVYSNTGTWIEFLDVTSVDHYSHALVSWDETKPTSTTVSIGIRWPGDVLYQIQNENPQRLKGILYGHDMRAGSSKETLELRVRLTTSDTSVTPSVSNLRVHFEPCSQDDLEIVLDGESCVPDDNSLLNWGRGWIGTSGNPPTLEADWSDLYSETNYPWMSRDLETITATLKYWSNTIDAVTFEAEASKYRLGYQRSYWSVPLTPFFSGPTLCSYTTLTSWWPIQKVYEWIIIDKGQAIHADGKYIVGHYQRDFLPGSLLVGTVNRRYNPGSLLVEGYLRNINPGSLLVQGPRRDVQPGMVIVAEPYRSSQPGSFLVAVEHLTSNPGSFLIYGVNRDGSIFVNVIDDNTYQTLIDLGVTFS